MIKFNCKSCNQGITVKDELAGRQGKCPACKALLTVPNASVTAPSEAAPRPAPPAAAVQKPGTSRPSGKKGGVDEDDVVEAEEAEEEVEAAEVVEDEEAPKKRTGKKRRRDDDSDDVEEAEEDEDEDDRPSKKSKRRREDEEAEDEDEARPMSPRKRRAAFRRASLGMFLSAIGTGLYCGGILFCIIASLYLAIAASSKAQSGETLLKILCWLAGLLMLAGFILHIVGPSLTITTPGKGAVLGFSIAMLATSAVGGLLFLYLFSQIFFSSGGGRIGGAMFLPHFALNPFNGFQELHVPIGGESGTFVAYVLPLVELGRLVCEALYLWAVGKSTRNSGLKGQGFIASILSPTACAVAGVLFFFIKLFEPKSLSGVFWILALFIALEGLLFIAALGFMAFSKLKGRSALAHES